MNQLRKVKKDRDVLESTIISRDKIVLQLRDHIGGYKNQIFKLNNIIEDFKAEIARRDKEDNEDDISDINTSLNDLSHLDITKGRMKKIIKKLQNEREMRKEEIEELKKEIEDLKSKMRDKEEYCQEILRRVQDLENEQKLWNIVVDHHGDEVKVNMDKVYLLDTDQV